MKITKSKIIKAPLILLILGAVILILSFINILSLKRDIKLSDDTLEKISKIDWNILIWLGCSIGITDGFVKSGIPQKNTRRNKKCLQRKMFWQI